MRTDKSYLERLYEKISPEPNSGCWLWTGALNRDGYSNFMFCGQSTVAHRASYILHKGNIPPGLEIDHLCRVRCCVNPDHLEAVTTAENIARSPFSLPNKRRAQTHCIHGHVFDEINTYRDRTTGKRQCRICSRDRMRGYRATGAH
jgi:hypothetical protein